KLLPPTPEMEPGSQLVVFDIVLFVGGRETTDADARRPPRGITCPVPSRWLRECRPSGVRPLLGLNLRGKCQVSSGDLALRYPITGIAGCCARAASGHVAAAPPSAASNSRRPMVTVIRPSHARCVEGRIPRHERAVFTFKEGRMCFRLCRRLRVQKW